MMQKIRELDLKKTPSISETLDWARALMALNAESIEEEIVTDTLNVILKYEGDVAKAQSELSKLIEKKTVAEPPSTETEPAEPSSEPAKKGILH